eukprot:TRINITY_DN966_c2_g1_i1.p1 TRINITY_DN966_c2_g1~~TRINITY_DN966_c2_g1_i1.p1  ORF type:complete len:384 (+),score=133.33 TRINITY_DN966_c2_g1_i1:97-1248(+)
MTGSDSEHGSTYREHDVEGNAEEEKDKARATRARTMCFLYIGTAVLLLGIVLGVIGISEGWISKTNFPLVVGGYCAALSTLLSVFHLLEHLSAFVDPDVQSRIIRILIMVPLYAVTSFLSMTFQSAATVLDLVRDSYESYALYTFFSLMMGLLGGTDALLRELMAEGSEPYPHPWPFCRIRLWSFTPSTLHWIRLSILQFMVLKPLCAIITIALEYTESYKPPQGSDEGSFSPKYGYVYLTVVYNISISVALYGLMYFYTATKYLLRAHNPFLKFLCIKGVLFLSYWQSLAIAILDACDALPKLEMWDDQATGLQDFLICCEMMMFSLAHKYVFSAHEVAQNSQEGTRLIPTARQNMWKNLKLTLKHEDVRNDFKDVWTFGRL